MKIYNNNQINSNSNRNKDRLNFKGDKAIGTLSQVADTKVSEFLTSKFLIAKPLSRPEDILNLKYVQKFSDCGLDQLQTKLVNSVSEKAPQMIRETDGIEYVPDFSIAGKALNAIISFACIPLDVLNGVLNGASKNFGKIPEVTSIVSKVRKFPLLKKYNNWLEFEREVNAFQGVQEKTSKLIKNAIESGKEVPNAGKCDKSESCKVFCKKIADKFNEDLNEKMKYNVGTYDTKKERFAARIVSGFTAALFLGNDFYNKAVKKGKNPEDAKKEQHLKQGQEIRENICEGVTNFAVAACFSKWVNKSVTVSALISTGVSLVSRIVARKASKMPIGRIEVPKRYTVKAPNINEFAAAAKTGNIKDIEKSTRKTEYVEEKNNKSENAKKPLLSPKNILAFCGLSILGGYAFKSGKNFLGKILESQSDTKVGKQITKFIEDQQNKIIEEVLADRDDLIQLSKILASSGEEKLATSIKADVLKQNKDFKKIFLGTNYKTTKVLKWDLSTKDLYGLLTAPFRCVKDLALLPHKFVSKLESGIKYSILDNMEKTDQKTRNAILKYASEHPQETPDRAKKIIKKYVEGHRSEVSEETANKIMGWKPKELIRDEYNIKNIYKRFMDFKAKYGDNPDPDKLGEEFGKYIKEMRLASNDNVNSSSNDNSKIAVLAQIFGTITGIMFNMNDEFNSSVRNGAVKEEAQKDARLRGINKIFRMAVQTTISGSLNAIFSKQYNSSIAKAGAVVAASTVLTDMAARALTGMPSKKMTKEELEDYQKNHKEGKMAWYYDMIDKLAS